MSRGTRVFALHARGLGTIYTIYTDGQRAPRDEETLKGEGGEGSFYCYYPGETASRLSVPVERAAPLHMRNTFVPVYLAIGTLSLMPSPQLRDNAPVSLLSS